MSDPHTGQVNQVRYFVRAETGMVYGPANVPTLSEWVRQQRLAAETLVAREGSTRWQRADSVPEIASLFGAGNAAPTPAQPGPAGYQSASLPYPSSPPPNGLAIASMVCSLVGVCTFPIVLALVGLILGVIARSQIRASAGRQSGDGMALTGIIVGAIALGLWCIVVAGYVVLVFVVAAGAH